MKICHQWRKEDLFVCFSPWRSFLHLELFDRQDEEFVDLSSDSSLINERISPSKSDRLLTISSLSNHFNSRWHGERERREDSIQTLISFNSISHSNERFSIKDNSSSSSLTLTNKDFSSSEPKEKKRKDFFLLRIRRLSPGDLEAIQVERCSSLFSPFSCQWIRNDSPRHDLLSFIGWKVFNRISSIQFLFRIEKKKKKNWP